jgi:hypothetical protein
VNSEIGYGCELAAGSLARPLMKERAAGIPSPVILQVVVYWRWFGAGKCRFSSVFGFETCSCTPLFWKAKPNGLRHKLLIDNILKAILRVKSLASFGNSAFCGCCLPETTTGRRHRTPGTEGLLNQPVMAPWALHSDTEPIEM